MAAEHL